MDEPKLGLRQVLQLEWVIIGGIRDLFIIEACLFVVLWGSNPWHLFYRVSRKGPLIEGLECGFLSHHATIFESLGPSLLVV